MNRAVVGCLAVLFLSLWFAGTSQGQAGPEFRLGFNILAERLGTPVVGVPLEHEHHDPINGDGLQKTSRGLMVWRNADNWTAFTNGSRTWVNGPFGVMERANEQRFEWEDPAPVSTPAPAIPVPPTPAATQTPGPTPTPSPPRVSNTNSHVVQGTVIYSDRVWVMGELKNEGSVPAYDILVSGRLLSASGSVAGAGDDRVSYLGPGDTVAYSITVQSPSPYVRAEVSVSAKGQPNLYNYMKANVSNTALRKTASDFRFAGIASNGNGVPLRSLSARVWFLDAQNNVVDMVGDSLPGDLAPGGSTNFDLGSRGNRYNPETDRITQGKAYVWGYR